MFQNLICELNNRNPKPRMLVTVLENQASAIVTIGENFKILVGDPEDESILDNCHLWLMMNTTAKMDWERVIQSGAELGVTYFHSVFLPEKITKKSYVFKSFNEPMNLPFGWKVYPVSSGTACTNWVFVHESENRVLVCGETDIYPNCLFRDRYESQHRIDALVHLSKGLGSQKPTQVSDLAERLNPSVRLNVLDGFAAIAIAVQAANLIDSDQNIRVTSSQNRKTSDHLDLVPSLFEWLSEDFQLHLRMCVTTQPYSIFGSSKNIHVSDTPVQNEKLIINIDPEARDNTFHIIGRASSEELSAVYSPAALVTSGNCEIEESEKKIVACHSSQISMIESIKLRFPEAIEIEKEISVVSLNTKVVLDNEGNACEVETIGNLDIIPLLHLVI